MQTKDLEEATCLYTTSGAFFNNIFVKKLGIEKPVAKTQLEFR